MYKSVKVYGSGASVLNKNRSNESIYNTKQIQSTSQNRSNRNRLKQPMHVFTIINAEIKDANIENGISKANYLTLKDPRNIDGIAQYHNPKFSKLTQQETEQLNFEPETVRDAYLIDYYRYHGFNYPINTKHERAYQARRISSLDANTKFEKPHSATGSESDEKDSLNFETDTNSGLENDQFSPSDPFDNMLIHMRKSHSLDSTMSHLDMWQKDQNIDA